MCVDMHICIHTSRVPILKLREGGRNFSASMFIILNIVKSRVIWVQQLRGARNKTPKKLLKFFYKNKIRRCYNL